MVEEDDGEVVRHARSLLASDKSAASIRALLQCVSVSDLMRVLRTRVDAAQNAPSSAWERTGLSSQAQRNGDEHVVADVCAALRVVLTFVPRVSAHVPQAPELERVPEVEAMWTEPGFGSTKELLMAGLTSAAEQVTMLCHALWQFYFDVIACGLGHETGTARDRADAAQPVPGRDRAACLVEHEDVVLQVARNVESAQSAVAQDAKNLLVHFCAGSERAAETVLAAGGGFVPSLLSHKNEIVALRALDLMLELAPFCRAAAVASSGAFRSGIESRDVLVRLSYMEALAAATRSPRSCVLFDQLDSVPLLASALAAAMDPPDVTLLAGITRVLSGMDFKRVMDDQTQQSREQLTRLFTNLVVLLDPSHARTVTVELRNNVRYALSMICVQSPVALNLLVAKLRLYCACMARSSTEFATHNAESEVCVQGITRILLHSEHAVAPSVGRALFVGLGGSDAARSEVEIMRALVRWVRLPFVSAQASALELFVGVSSYEWGARTCAATPDWLECVLEVGSALNAHTRNTQLAVLRKLCSSFSEAQLASWFGAAGASRMLATFAERAASADIHAQRSTAPPPNPQVDLATR
ncbi:hypothetical protein FVE85_9837 [Porphyridium purpureum]|uniref:Uncharacterized protein n=1 Tax=Porphyridium purpureum TaxID=35688 RepID=A0A5J4YII0_PORPP|nr:hypothetical protein FVE85_9837 [Porphyridium purpureum]|eukprot:POR7209..scf289_17